MSTFIKDGLLVAKVEVPGILAGSLNKRLKKILTELIGERKI